MVWGYAPLRVDNVTSLRASQPSHTDFGCLHPASCHSRYKAGFHAAAALSTPPVSANRAPQHLSASGRISRPTPAYQPAELRHDNIGRVVRTSALDGANDGKIPISSSSSNRGHITTKAYSHTSQSLATRERCDEIPLVSNGVLAKNQGSATAPGVSSSQQNAASTSAGKPSASASAAEVASGSSHMEKDLAMALSRLPRRSSSGLVLDGVVISLPQMSRYFPLAPSHQCCPDKKQTHLDLSCARSPCHRFGWFSSDTPEMYAALNSRS